MALSKVDVESGGTGLVAAGASGNVLTSDGTDWTSTAPADELPAAGSDGNVLTSDGTNWASEAPAAGAAWVKLSSVTASNSASVTLTGMAHATYDTHILVFSRFQPASSGQNLNLRVRRSSDGRIESLNTYSWHLTEAGDNTTSGNGIVGANVNYARIAVEPHNFGSNVGGAGGTLYFTNADTVDQHITWHGTFASGKQGNVTGGQIVGQYNGDEGNGSELDGVSLYFASGNIVSGRATLYGLSHS